MPSFCIMSDTQITSPTWSHSVCQIHWTRDLCICHYTEWQHEITSPTWRHSVKCQIHRSRVQHVVILYNGRYTDHESIIILYNVRYTDHKSNMPSFCIMSDTQITSPTWSHSVCQIHLDSWSVYLTFYRMTPCWTHDLCIWHFTEWHHVDSWSVYLPLYRMTTWDHESNMVSFCKMSDAQIMSPTWRHSVKCQIHRSRVQHVVILYNGRYTDHESIIILYNVRYTDHKSNMPSFCIMSDTQITSPTWSHSVCQIHWTRDLCICHYTEWQHEITSPTWRHSVKCQIHRSRVQHVVILYNGRYTDHESIIILYNVRYTDHKSNMPSFCIMSDTQITSPTWSHSVCQIHLDSWSASDIIQNDDGLVICISDIIQNDTTLDSWSVHLTFYRMTPCWTHDLCI